MIDLEAIRRERNAGEDRLQVKTFLTPSAINRLKAAAEFAGCHQYEIIERLILEELPEVQ